VGALGRAASAVVALGCVAAALLGAPPAAAAFEPATIDRYLADGLAATGLPGMAVAVVRGGEVVHVAGYGTDGNGDPVTPRTPFRVGSLTKSFTAAAVLQLAAEGRVDLDAPVRAYLPGFPVVGPITVRHLLNQTSGLADPAIPSLNDPHQDLAQRVASLRDVRPVSEPGREFHYCDVNYQVLAQLVEVVSGRSWAENLGERVFAPLGAADSVAGATTTQAGAPPGHVLLFGVPVARPELDGLVAGSGGVVSTALDMGRWLAAQASGGGPVLRPGDVALMQTPPPGVAGGYAMGWQVVAPGRLAHTGVLSTYSAIQVLLPGSGQGFVLLFNGSNALADTAGLAAGLADLLTGGTEPPGPRSTALVAAALGAAAVAVLALRVRQLARVPRWRGRARGWRAVAGPAWLLLPTALLAGLPTLLSALIGRSFTFWQLCLAMPDVVVLIAVWALSGVALAAARTVAITRRPAARE